MSAIFITPPAWGTSARRRRRRRFAAATWTVDPPGLHHLYGEVFHRPRRWLRSLDVISAQDVNVYMQYSGADERGQVSLVAAVVSLARTMLSWGRT